MYTDDRPPFAISAAAEHPSSEPEHLSLDDNRSGLSKQSNFSSSAPSQSYQEVRSRDYYPDPVASNRSPGPSSLPDNQKTKPTTARPDHQRVKTNSDDENMSSSRSRRLLTGYLLGDPRSAPADSRPLSPNDTPEFHVRNPTPPEENDTYHNGPLDSPPVSVVQDDEDDSTSAIQRLAQMRIKGKKPRQDSNIRDKETGYDRLNGLNDGEADLDESAPQAEGDGSEAYLRGVEGPSGEYHFPTHRLRTTMKGESQTLRGTRLICR